MALPNEKKAYLFHMNVYDESHAPQLHVALKKERKPFWCRLSCKCNEEPNEANPSQVFADLFVSISRLALELLTPAERRSSADLFCIEPHFSKGIFLNGWDFFEENKEWFQKLM